MTGNPEIVRLARGWLGTPFVAGAKVKGQGVDCLQLLVAVYEEYTGRKVHGIPTYSVRWYEREASPETYMKNIVRWLPHIGSKWEDAEIGDAVLFRVGYSMRAKHSAIVSGEGRMIHCLSKRCVDEVPLGSDDLARVAGIYRYPRNLQTKSNFREGA